MKKLFLMSTLALALVQSGFAIENGNPQRVSLKVTENGFEPARVQVTAGQEVLIIITRTTDATCAKSVVIPKLKLKENLPLNKPVTLKLAKLEKGELKFACGMNMMSAVIEAQ